MVEDAPGSRGPVRDSSPHFPVFEEFKGASYLKRYDLLCQRLVQEQLYTTAAVIAAERSAVDTGDFSNDAIGRCGFPSGDGIASSRPRRRAGRQSERAAGPPEARGVGRDRVAVRGEGGLQFLAQAGRSGGVAGGRGGERGGADTGAVEEVFVRGQGISVEVES